MKAKSPLLLLVMAVLVGSCGLTPPHFPTITGPGNPLSGEVKVKLVVFGAQWCPECKVDLPFLQRALYDRLGSDIGAVKIELWVPTGSTPSSPTSQEAADYYLQLVHMNGKAFPDGIPKQKPPRWPKFAELFPFVKKALPAAAIYKADGTLYKKFAPGADTFNPSDIVATVAEVLNK